MFLEVKNQRVIAKRTSQIMKYGQDVIIQKRTDDNNYPIREVVLAAPDRVNIPCLMHDTRHLTAVFFDTTWNNALSE